jgi:hypothetical protein
VVLRLSKNVQHNLDARRILFAVAASYQDVAAGPDNRPTKEPGLRPNSTFPSDFAESALRCFACQAEGKGRESR